MDAAKTRDLLNTIRWISAAVVCIGHALALLLPPATGYLGGLLDSARHDAVIVFFVVSGYLVGGGVLGLGSRLDVKRYAIARFSRIYIVLAPAIILIASLDGLAHAIDPHSPIYASVWPGGVMGEVAPFDRYTFPAVLATITCLENFVGPPMGSAGPLWSLGFEWVFYFAFPALVLAADAAARVLNCSPWLARGALVALSVVALIAMGKFYLALLWLIWIAGAVTRVVCDTLQIDPRLRVLGLLIFGLGIMASPMIGYRLADVLIGFGFAIFLSSRSGTEKGLNADLDQRLANHSYSTYVIHLPILAFMAFWFNRAGWLPPGGVAPSLAVVGMFTAMMVAVGLVAILFERLFESRTDRLRQFLLRRA